MSGLEKRWKVLSDLLVVLRSQGADIPPDVVGDLRSARSLIEVLKVSPECEGVAGTVDQLLANVEVFLLAEAEEKLGREEAKKWREKIARSIEEAEGEALETSMRFRPGLPRGEHWVRIRVSDDIPADLLEGIAEEEGVSTELQPDGFLLVKGSKEKVRSFIKKLSERLRPR